MFSRQPFGDYQVEIGRYSTGESGFRVVNQQQVLFLEELDVDNDRLPDVWKFYAKGRVNLRKWKRNQSVFIALVFEHYELFGELNGNNGQPGQFNLRVKSKDRYFDSESIRLNVGDEIIVTKLFNETINESLGKISAEQTIYYEPFKVVIDTNKMTRQGLTKLFGDLNQDLLKMPEEKAASVQLAVIPDSTNRDSGPPKSGSSVQNVR